MKLTLLLLAATLAAQTPPVTGFLYFDATGKALFVQIPGATLAQMPGGQWTLTMPPGPAGIAGAPGPPGPSVTPINVAGATVVINKTPNRYAPAPLVPDPSGVSKFPVGVVPSSPGVLPIIFTVYRNGVAQMEGPDYSVTGAVMAPVTDWAGSVVRVDWY